MVTLSLQQLGLPRLGTLQHRSLPLLKSLSKYHSPAFQSALRRQLSAWCSPLKFFPLSLHKCIIGLHDCVLWLIFSSSPSTSRRRKNIWKELEFFVLPILSSFLCLIAFTCLNAPASQARGVSWRAWHWLNGIESMPLGKRARPHRVKLFITLFHRLGPSRRRSLHSRSFLQFACWNYPNGGFPFELV